MREERSLEFAAFELAMREDLDRILIEWSLEVMLWSGLPDRLRVRRV